MRSRSPQAQQAFDDWVERARRVSLVDALARVPHQAKRRGAEFVGPCPGCGGTDRFSIHIRRNVWNCRVGGVGGGVVAFAQHVMGCDFLGAVEWLTGEKPPHGGQSTAPDPAALAARQASMAEQEKRRAEEHNTFRMKEINRARAIWAEAKPMAGSTSAAYLALRGVEAPPDADLRSHEAQKYWHPGSDGKHIVVHQGPAMIAAIRNGEGRVEGCHITWLDLSQANGKAVIVDPSSGEILPSKKMRGSKRGGRICLGGHKGNSDLIVGEGIETVLSVRQALIDAKRDVSHTLFWAAGDLGNIGGKALSSVNHPTAFRKDVRGAMRRVRVPGPRPDLSETQVLMPPDYVRQVLLLGDGDSDGFTTSQHLLRAAARWKAAGRQIRIAWADAGSDFNDMWRAA